MRKLGLSAAVLVCAGTVGTATGHPDDPKVLDRQPRYEGPGYREIDGLRDPPLEFPAQGLTLRSWLTLGNFGSFSSGNDCWGYVSPSGREYAIMGLNAGSGYVEVTNPGAATIIGVIPGPNSMWRDVKVYSHYAYVVSEGGGGIQVVDLSNIDNGTVTLVNSVTTGGATSTHNVAIDTDSGYLYRTGGGNNVGLRIYDLSDPANPAFVGQWNDRYVHDAQVITMPSGPFAGRQIAFCCTGFNNGSTETGFEILDVTDKSSIVQLARIAYSGTSYSHQVWVSPDLRYAYLDDELDEQTFGTPTTTRIIDIRDLNHPVEVGTFTTGLPAVDHNLYIRDTLIFEANYRSGLRVFDATDPLNPVQVAWYDTYPDNDNPNFNGLWSNYPFFPSGTIIGSDIERGLFVWTLDGHPLSIYFPDRQPTRIGSQGETLRVQMIENTSGSLNPSSVTLHTNIGGGWTATPMTALGGNLYEADFPVVDCIQTIEYYVTAATLAGAPVRSPIPTEQTYSALVYDEATPVIHYDFDTTAGWARNIDGTDNATTGLWVRGNPNGTLAQPENCRDGSNCWFTGQGSPGGSLGEQDIDNGVTTLFSPVIDMSGLDQPAIRLWRWYSNATGAAPASDTATIDVSNNGGSTWTTMELIGPNGPGTNGGWMYREFLVSNFVTPTSQMRIRYRASDLGAGSIVEAALDEVSIVDLSCFVVAPCPGDANGNGQVDLEDLLILLTQFGQTGPGLAADFNGDGSVDLGDLLLLLGNFGESCN